MGLSISNAGIELIKQFEGCRLNAYLDSAGVPTIGYGHTAGVKMGQAITQTQAEAFLKEDLAKFEQLVGKYDSAYHWNQNQFDALVSFAFNIGNIDQLTANGTRDVKTIADKMLLYNKITINGVKTPSAGLYTRREKEQKLFLKPVTQDAKSASVQAAEQSTVPSGTEHIQLNYQAGSTYKVVVDDLRIRTKLASQSPDILPNAGILGRIANGTKVKNQATARVIDQIWMYIGVDSKGREQWICADTGNKAYIQ